MTDHRARAERPGRALAVAALGTLLSLVSFTAPISTLVVTGAGLGAGVDGRTWILSSMSIGLSAALLTAGAIADDFGRRRTFVAGLCLLATGSVICALVPTVEIFVLGRVLEGVGAGAVIAASLGIIAHAFPAGPARAHASGVWGAALGGGIALGPLLSAVLAAWWSFRGIYVLIAVGALVLAALALLLVDESGADEPRGLDRWGALVLVVGISSLLAALVEGRSGWGRPGVIVLAVLAVLALVGFVVVEAHSRAPMFDLALARRPDFVAATVAALATGAGVIALLSYLSGFVVTTLGVTALAAAVLMLGWSAVSVVTALLARHLPVRLSGRHQLAGGLVVVGLAMVLLTGVDSSTTLWHFVPGLVLAGLASGIVNAALGREAVASVPAGRASMGSGANNTARYVGSALGVTVVSVLAARPGPGTPIENLTAGWNLACLVAAGVSLAGGAVVLACRPRR